MRDGTTIAAVIAKVLGYKGLPLGPRVSETAAGGKGAPVGIRAFRGSIGGITASLSEDLLLVTQGDEGTLAAVRSALSDPTSERFLIAAETEVAAQLNEFASENRHANVVDFSDLYRRLCEIPNSLPEMILAKARRDFNLRAYQERYQQRHLRVISSPDAMGAKRVDHANAGEYLVDWARADSARHPILLLGERGSGKTWQLLHFSGEMFALHQREPWIYGPAFFFELREEYARLGPYGVSVPVFSQAVLREYAGVRYLWEAPLVEAFLCAGHTILCVDGFEEVSHVAGGGASAVDLLRRVCATLPLGTRFVITCRPSHFGSLDQLLDLEVWRGLAVRDAFEVLALEPFEEASVKSYLESVSPSAQAAAVRSLELMLATKPGDSSARDDDSRAAVREALRTCSKQPALLAAMVDHVVRNRTATLHPTDLLAAALIGAMVDYNIQMGKAQDVHYRPDRTKVSLGTEQRMELLGELVWHVAARGQEYIDLDELPPRIVKYFSLDLDSVLTDIRTHTLLDIVPSAPEDAMSPADNNSERTRRSSVLSFALPFGDGSESDSTPDSPHGDFLGGQPSRAIQIAKTALSEAPAGAKSVSGAFLLARHIAKTLERATWVPTPSGRPDSVPFVDRLRALGEVPLGLAAAGMLREIIERRQVLTRVESPQDLVDLALLMIAGCARQRDLSIYSSCLRYLGHNLEAMGLITGAEREEIDPWADQRLRAVVRAPQRLPGYKMVIVPAPAQRATPHDLREAHIDDSAPGVGRPFLLGVQEITNQDFLAFLSSREGENWRVEGITIAGSTRGVPRSRWASYANEYYLYFWEEAQYSDGPTHRPIESHLRHPVGYVSWFACAAFCDWLTRGENPGREVYADYWRADAPLYGPAVDAESQLGYRLPAVREWSWAARGGRLDIAYPWDLYPLALAETDLQQWLSASLSKPNSDSERDARQWMQKWRSEYRAALLTMPKEHIPVLMDPFGPLGASGMMGNVKEWCHNLAGTERNSRPILGTTSYLGERSFSYDYGMALFPQNTNPDVGFRVSRPLSDEEIALLSSREEKLSRIGNLRSLPT